jgi:penicillin-binding protein 1C
MRLNHLRGRRVILASLTLGLLGLTVWMMQPVLPLDADRVSSVLQDRDGEILHIAAVDDGRIRLPVSLDQIDPDFVEALILIEDKRFYAHHGVDPVAIVRALNSNIRAGRTVSGASTITQQLVRQYKRRPRTVRSKAVEAAQAIRLDLRMGKAEQLERYLTRVSYGSNIEGIRAATRLWLGKSPRYLTSDEIALLLALPQSPESRRPDRNPMAARKGRDQILDRMWQAGLIDETELSTAKSQPISSHRNRLPDRDILAHATFGNGVSALDADLQSRVATTVAKWTEKQPVPVNAAALVIHAKTREVRALVGTGARDHAGGWIDMTDRVRSPGSTLKPFIYALAMDDGVLDYDSNVRDAPTRFGTYRPENFTRRYHGQVTVREALQHSLNVPAVTAMHLVGADRFRAAMAAAGPEARGQVGDQSGEGLALALGGTGLSARDLAVLYTALANNGEAAPLRFKLSSDVSDTYQLMTEAAAKETLSALRGAPVPKGFANMPGVGRMAYKTGTSYGSRDSWAAGIAGDYVILIWTGRPDGAPRPGATGRASAAPLLFDLARPFITTEHKEHRDHAPSGLQAVESVADQGPVILFPSEDTELLMSNRGISISVDSDDPVEVYVSGKRIKARNGVRRWTPEHAGFYRVTAIDRQGRSTNANVRVVTHDQLIDAPPQFR